MRLTSLTQTELLRVVNSTPLGSVLTRSRLRQQLDVGALAFGDGRRLDLLRYIGWLATERAKPPRERTDYAEAKRRQAARNRAATKAAQDIAPIPDVADMSRRKATQKDLRTFCEEYFSEAFCWPWSADHLAAIATLERIITGGGLFAFAMYRGAGKTTLARTAALWAVLGDYTPYACLIGGTDLLAKRQLLDPLKMAALENYKLLADFPEAIYPLRCLENSSKRQLQQHIGGRLTHVRWEPQRLVFPTIAEEDLPKALRDQGVSIGAASGSVIDITSLEANIKGRQHTRPDGSVLRPGLVLLDDPQTRESARSATQTDYRWQLIHGDVLGLAGPGQNIAAVAMVTKIYADDLSDRLLDPERSPDWQSQCTKLMLSFPADEVLWDRYAEIRRKSIQAGKQGRAATAFYRKHRRAMDRGAEVAWSECYDRRSELSAIQYAMNLKLRNEEAFFAEYQNEPMQEQLAEDLVLPRQVAEKFNGRARGAVPLAASRVTVFVDVHARVLYWTACAWEADFTGYVIDYGVFPAQGQAWFEARKARQTLRRMFPGAGEDGAILAGLERLVGELLQREWRRTRGGVLRADPLLVDMGYKPKLVAAVKHKIGGAAMLLSLGKGIGARNKPMAQYRRKPGERHGHHWYIPNVRGTQEFPHVATDVNYYKTFVHRALATPAGEPGALSLFGKKAKSHELFAEHVAGAETWVETEGHGRTVHEWKLRPSKPDNHWLDCLVGCAAAAAIAGCKTAGMESRQQQRRKRYTQADLAGRKS